ncbi:rRNA maturation RNase YbeY [Patescibacteria group bacterium]|nr:rRNA maturation RNase YbeY [Patescibacteria group bacterium]
MISVVCTGKLPKGISEDLIRSALHRTCLAVHKQSVGAVSVSFISAQRIAALNKRWRKHDHATDVLSFAPAEVPGMKNTEKEWGDLFLNTSVIQREATARSITLKEEVLRNVIHGLLHLFGFDHATKKEETAMFGIQERVLQEVLSAV